MLHLLANTAEMFWGIPWSVTITKSHYTKTLRKKNKLLGETEDPTPVQQPILEEFVCFKPSSQQIDGKQRGTSTLL